MDVVFIGVVSVSHFQVPIQATFSIGNTTVIFRGKVRIVNSIFQPKLFHSSLSFSRRIIVGIAIAIAIAFSKRKLD